MCVVNAEIETLYDRFLTDNHGVMCRFVMHTVSVSHSLLIARHSKYRQHATEVPRSVSSSLCFYAFSANIVVHIQCFQQSMSQPIKTDVAGKSKALSLTN